MLENYEENKRLNAIAHQCPDGIASFNLKFFGIIGRVALGEYRPQYNAGHVAELVEWFEGRKAEEYHSDCPPDWRMSENKFLETLREINPNLATEVQQQLHREPEPIPNEVE